MARQSIATDAVVAKLDNADKLNEITNDQDESIEDVQCSRFMRSSVNY